MKIIDLSHWNDVHSLDEAREAGVLGVIHKCTQGIAFIDETYVDRMERAHDAGLAFAAYHFLEAGNASQQMEHFLDRCFLPDGSRLVIDYEAMPDAPPPTLDDLHECLEWLSINAPSMQICIYGGSLLKEQLGYSYDEQLAETSLWLAQYTSAAPTWPTGTWSVWTVWQYTDAACVPGINGPCDANEFNGSDASLLKWFGPVGVPEPEAEIATITLDLTVTGNAVVAISVNGRPWGDVDG
jgi:lysozyme